MESSDSGLEESDNSYICYSLRIGSYSLFSIFILKEIES